MKLSRALTHWAGSPAAVLGSIVIIVVWAVTGPVFGFSDTWQLVINTATTILTFNMVFIIQASQNHDGAAIQAKLDELIRALEGTDERLIRIEEEDNDA